MKTIVLVKKVWVILGMSITCLMLNSCNSGGTNTGSQKTVTIEANSGPGSLRQVIADADAGDVVTFDDSMRGKVIKLSSPILVNKNLTIKGLGKDVLTIEGSGSTAEFGGVFRIGQEFYIQDTVLIEGLTITKGKADLGGNIFSMAADLRLKDVTVSNGVGTAGIYVGYGDLTTAKLTLQGATLISQNTEAGVYINRMGTFVMEDDSSVTKNALGGVSNFGTSIMQGRAVIKENLGVGISNVGTLTIQNEASVLDNINTSGNFGGGIANSGTLILKDNARVNGNKFSPENLGGRGGGISNSGVVSLQDNVVISGNSVTGEGGGIYNSKGATFTLDGSSKVIDNQAGEGGGAYNEGGKVSLKGFSSISNNTAVELDFSLKRGGGISNQPHFLIDENGQPYNFTPGVVTLENNASVTGNTANQGEGGGIYNGRVSTLTLLNDSFISSNTASVGGGIYNWKGTLTGVSEQVNVKNNLPNNITEVAP